MRFIRTSTVVSPPGNSWIPHNFQFQQPHKHSYFYLLANHMQLAHRYIRYALWALSVLGIFMWPHQSTKWHLKGPLATPKCYTLSFLIVYTCCYHGENVNWSRINSTWVTSFINYSWEKSHDFTNSKHPTIHSRKAQYSAPWTPHVCTVLLL